MQNGKKCISIILERKKNCKNKIKKKKKKNQILIKINLNKKNI